MCVGGGEGGRGAFSVGSEFFGQSTINNPWGSYIFRHMGSGVRIYFS